MPKSAANPLPDPLPSVGGSYLLNESTGQWELLSRTEPATPPVELPVEPPATLPAEPPTEPPAES